MAKTTKENVQVEPDGQEKEQLDPRIVEWTKKHGRNGYVALWVDGDTLVAVRRLKTSEVKQLIELYGDDNHKLSLEMLRAGRLEPSPIDEFDQVLEDSDTFTALSEGLLELKRSRIKTAKKA